MLLLMVMVIPPELVVIGKAYVEIIGPFLYVGAANQVYHDGNGYCSYLLVHKVTCLAPVP